MLASKSPMPNAECRMHPPFIVHPRSTRMLQTTIEFICYMAKKPNRSRMRQRKSICVGWMIMVASNLAWPRRKAVNVTTRSMMANGLSFASTPKVGILGGGASGIFASISCSENNHETDVTVLEATGKTLTKVAISGGGRCNVLHDTTKAVPVLLDGYPRGKRELNGLFHKSFPPSMARQWFEQRGVTLKTEADGRMFPTTDNSQTIIDTLLQAADKQGVFIEKRTKIVKVSKSEDDGLFTVTIADGSSHQYHALILATGSSRSGYEIAQSLGHDIVSPIPSLFTLNSKPALNPEHGFLFGLAGVSVPQARVTLAVSPATPGKTKRRKKQKTIEQEGPLLVTHHGVSGPAVLKLSAFAAREFHEVNYNCSVSICWDIGIAAASPNVEAVLDALWECTRGIPKRQIASACPLPGNTIPRRLWAALVHHSGMDSTSEVDLTWGNISKKRLRPLAANLIGFSLPVTGKGTFKEEFVTAGGVNLKEVDMKTMMSKKVPGLFFCGELLNVDGITGGYNFMNCWGTGYVAGNAAAEYCQSVARGTEEAMG